MEKIKIEEIVDRKDSIEKAKATILAQGALAKVFESIDAGDKAMARRRLDYLMGVLTTLVEVGLMDAEEAYPFIDEIGENIKEMK